MGCSTGGLLVDKQEDLERIFANGNRIIGVHAEDETRLHQRRRLLAGRTDPAVHSRNPRQRIGAHRHGTGAGAVYQVPPPTAHPAPVHVRRG